MTKYEYDKQQLDERKKREANINNLNMQLNEAKELYHTIRGLEKSFENQQSEWKVLQEIRRLEDLIKDEQIAHDSTFEVDPDSVNKAIKLLNI